MPRIAILKYYIYTIPWYISIALPMSVLISTVFTIETMKKMNELTALKSSGISFFRFSVPFLILGISISIFSFEFDNKIVTSSFKKRVNIEQENQMWGPVNKNKKKREIFRQIGIDKILYIKRFQYSNNLATNVTIQEFKDNNLSKRIDISRMIWKSSDSLWYANDMKIKQWNGTKLINSSTIHSNSSIDLDISPQQLMIESTRPREMNYSDLKEFVDKMKSNAISHPNWEVDLYFKTAFAATSFLMALFGLSLSMNSSRHNLAAGLGLSIITIFLYYISLKMGQSFGYKEIFKPAISVWGPNIIFLTVGIYLFTRVKT